MPIPISIITVCKNNVQTIADTLHSVVQQKIPKLQHILIDGCSTDGTLEIIKKSKTAWVSESDTGIYDAMNKGIALATGEIIGILNADDIYATPTVLKKVLALFEDPTVDAVYGNLVYVQKENLTKTVRYWQSRQYRPGLFRFGWMPPHPTFFVRKKIYAKYGSFDLRLPLAADYEIMLRFIERYKLKVVHIPQVLVKMRLGGASNKNIHNLIRNYQENVLAWKYNKLQRPWYTLILKRLCKLKQFIVKK